MSPSKAEKNPSGHTVGDFNGCQATTTREDIIPDARNTGRNNNGGQVSTIRECTSANESDRIRNLDGCQALAAIVFTTYCVSVNSN